VTHGIKLEKNFMKKYKSTNNFSEETRSLNIHEPYCEKCKSNDKCSLHHIYGRISKSAVNAIYLCHKCHAEADKFNRTTGIKGTQFRKELLKTRLKNLTKWGYTFKKEDMDFLTEIAQDIKDILK